MSRHETDRAIADLVRELSEVRRLDDAAVRITTFTRTTFGAQYAGITINKARGRLETVGATAPLVNRLDALQYDLREGPCVDAATEARYVASGDVRQDARWPRWGPAAADEGVSSMLSVELRGGGRHIGGMNLYGTRRDQFDEDDAAMLMLFSANASAALAAAVNVESLEIAVAGRTVIGQAQGILMERYGVDDAVAFSILRRLSQSANLKLNTIAEELVRTRELPDLPES